MAKPFEDKSVVIGPDGRPLDISPADAKATALRMFDEGDLLAVISRMPNGEISFNVMGPPSMKLVQALEDAIKQFRVAVEVRLKKR